MKASRLTIIGIALALFALAIVFGAVPGTAQAYGNSALWQVGVSVNCDNPSLCLNPPFGIGGFWGWIEFDPNGAGDATFAGCSHLSTSLGVLTGADSLHIDIANWTIGPGSAGPSTFIITGGTVTFAGVNTKGAPVTLPLSAIGGVFDTGVPAVPGHHNFSSLFGFTPPPGMSFQIQVVQLSH